ncbi:MAG: hypothetical protein Q4B22_09275 [Eubacteriales bacterium]|nr:hypothetical protein [Eubacteriales bacterium]
MNIEYLTQKAVYRQDDQNTDADSRNPWTILDDIGGNYRLEGKNIKSRKLRKTLGSVREEGVYMPDIYMSEEGEVVADFQLIPDRKET